MTVNVDYFFIWKQRQLHFRRFTTQKSAPSRRTVKVIVAIAYQTKRTPPAHAEGVRAAIERKVLVLQAADALREEEHREHDARGEHAGGDEGEGGKPPHGKENDLDGTHGTTPSIGNAQR